MRGPDREALDQQQQQQQQDAVLKSCSERQAHHQAPGHPKCESRLSKVKRALMLGRSPISGAGAGGAAGVGRGDGPGGPGPATPPAAHFGAPLELLERHGASGVCLLAHRLCGYIEAHGCRNPGLFRSGSEGRSRRAERLRRSFELRGDADLEAAGCPASAALLLRQFLEELPEPLVDSACVGKLLQFHVHERSRNWECWMEKTRGLLVNELDDCRLRLFVHLLLFLGRFESRHCREPGVCAIFAPIILAHVPPAAVLLHDLLQDAALIFPEQAGTKELSLSGVASSTDCKICKEPKNEFGCASDKSLPASLSKTPKRKERRDSYGHERKLIRSNSEEKIWESSKKLTDDSSVNNTIETIRRVSSHEDFNNAKYLHIFSKSQKDMGHGLRHNSLPLQERNNGSPMSSKTSLIHATNDVVLAPEKYDSDAEKLRNSKRFSRSMTPRGMRQVRRTAFHRISNNDQNPNKKTEKEDSEVILTLTSDSNKTIPEGQSFLEMLNSGPSRSPSPVRPQSLEHDEANNPTLTNWSFQLRQTDDEEMNERVEAMVSPRNSVLIPRRFYSEDKFEEQENIVGVKEYSLKSLMKQINSLKKKIKRYEDEFEDNFGYRPSHSDKMSNRDIKKIVSELNKVRKEHKILKDGFLSTLLSGPKYGCSEGVPINNNNNDDTEDKLRTTTMTEMVKEVERKLAEKRCKYSRSEDMDDLTYEELLDEKNSVQKALLHIENIFGRPVSKEDRSIVRPLYDKYRILKRLLIRAGANRYNDSMSELATILEHEAMDFTSTSGTPIDCDRRASEPDMSHRGILDCIDSMDQVPTDSDSQHSSSDGSRGVVESLHFLTKDELLQQQRVTKEEKKRLRRALKELEMQFEARVGRRMQKEDRGSQVNIIYDSYKQTKAKLRLISALLAKNT